MKDYNKNKAYAEKEHKCYRNCRFNKKDTDTFFCGNEESNYFEEREYNNMDIKKTIKECESKLDEISSTIDQLESQLVETIPDPDESNTPTNRYGLGQTLYLPLKVVGIRSKKTPNGSNIVLYEFSTDTDQRIGFKIFEHASDIRRDKNHCILSLPEEYIRDHFKGGE